MKSLFKCVFLFTFSACLAQNPAPVAGVAHQLFHVGDFDRLFNGKLEKQDMRVAYNAFFVAAGCVIGDADNFYISYGFDARNAFLGGTVNDRALNYKITIAYSKKFTHGMYYEGFKAVGYASVTAFTGYNLTKHISACVEANFIDNQNRQVLAPGAFSELKVLNSKDLYLSLLLNYKMRPEISKKGVFSGYINLNYKL